MAQVAERTHAYRKLRSHGLTQAEAQKVLDVEVRTARRYAAWQQNAEAQTEAGLECDEIELGA
ncbi:MAG TPA: hypothetical protein VLW50_02955 [Streptosporangiaceae bacterium]|nr:hypothetical protein [Streptosporangiaceae bacterium]